MSDSRFGNWWLGEEVCSDWAERRLVRAPTLFEAKVLLCKSGLFDMDHLFDYELFEEKVQKRLDDYFQYHFREAEDMSGKEIINEFFNMVSEKDIVNAIDRWEHFQVTRLDDIKTV